MLVLTRYPGESVIIKCGGERIVVTFIDLRERKARIGFEAGQNVQIIREELEDEWTKEKPQ